MLAEVGLGELTEVREFGRDDEDRIRGCYTSHIAVLKEAAERFADKDEVNVLVLEDNLSTSPRLSQATLDSTASFLRNARPAPDMLHLAYIMYVPGLSVERLPAQESIVRLRSSPGSVLGTTAYIVTKSGLDALMAEHDAKGYVGAQDGAIPNMMARLFPYSRYAAFPMPMHRAATIKSLVNGQLDDLRALIFQPQVYTLWERLLVGSGQNTNVLFPALCVVLLIGALAGGSEALGAIAARLRGEEVDLFLPLLGASLASACLAILGYGVALAPKPSEESKEDAKVPAA